MGKITQPAKDVHFFLWKPPPLKKSEKRYFIFYYKNRKTCQFYAFTIKSDFGNMSESGEFRYLRTLHWRA